MPHSSRLAVVFAVTLWWPPAGAGAVEESVPLQRIAFGSCANQERPQPIWEAVVATRPQLFLFLGDNIYADTKDMDQMRAKYAKLAARTGYQKLLKTCPILATWDDHDYGANDAGSDYPKKAESQQVFLDFFGEPKDSPRRKQEGVYSAKVFGPPGKRVQVILLDTRYFRSKPKTGGPPLPIGGRYVANTDPDATILGPAQWRWLEQQLRVPAELRLLCSSIQVVAEDHGFEKWMNFPRERIRLYQMLRDTRAAGVVILSGDRHLAELSMMDGSIGYPLYDLTSSGLTEGERRWRRLETNQHRVATMNQGNNFGLLTMDWDRKDPLVRLQIRDEEGEITLQQKLALSTLQPGVLRTIPPAGARLATGEPLTRTEAAKRVDKKVVVVMDVQSTGMSTKNGLIFLNSSADRTSSDNFTVVLDRAAQGKFNEAGIADLRAHFQEKTIRVSGTLSLFREQPQIIVSDPRQIEVVR